MRQKKWRFRGSNPRLKNQSGLGEVLLPSNVNYISDQTGIYYTHILSSGRLLSTFGVLTYDIILNYDGCFRIFFCCIVHTFFFFLLYIHGHMYPASLFLFVLATVLKIRAIISRCMRATPLLRLKWRLRQGPLNTGRCSVHVCVGDWKWGKSGTRGPGPSACFPPRLRCSDLPKGPRRDQGKISSTWSPQKKRLRPTRQGPKLGAPFLRTPIISQIGGSPSIANSRYCCLLMMMMANSS